MYKHHRKIIVLIFFISTLISYYLKLDYSKIVSQSITILSFFLVILTTSITNLISSNSLVDKLKKSSDKQIVSKSELGVYITYIKTAFYFEIANIVLNCLFIILKNTIQICIIKILSILGFSILSINFYIIFLIFKFLIERQLYN